MGRKICTEKKRHICTSTRVNLSKNLAAVLAVVAVVVVEVVAVVRGREVIVIIVVVVGNDQKLIPSIEIIFETKPERAR